MAKSANDNMMTRLWLRDVLSPHALLRTVTVWGTEVPSGVQK